MKVYDCFTFFNELDLLEFRLNLLAPHIDYFVIVESNLSHAGKPKPFFFEENRTRFSKWEEKIVYRPIIQSTEGLVFEERDVHSLEDGSWFLENQQRNAIKDAIVIRPEDIVLISDLDEIPNPVLIKELEIFPEPRALSMLFHYYFMNCRNIGEEKTWNGTVVVPGIYFNDHTCQYIRDNRNNYTTIPNGGWHFSYLGGLEKIKYKLQSFAHTEYNKEEFINDANILRSLDKGLDILKRPKTKFRFFPLLAYPGYLRKLMQQNPDFIRKTSITKWLLSYLR